LNVLVLGVGNVLLRDEGIGVRAVEVLQRRFLFSSDVEVLDGGTSGIELLTHIRERDCLIIIDAIKSGNAPGTVLRVEGEDVPARFRTRISPHQLGISDLLAAATLTDEMPKRLVLFGIEPKNIDTGLELSEEVRGGLDRLIEVVNNELLSLGCKVEQREAHETAGGKSVWGDI
jgi:hydrogenase maturation protease